MNVLQLLDGIAARVMSQLAPRELTRLHAHLRGEVTPAVCDGETATALSSMPMPNPLVWSLRMVPVALLTDAAHVIHGSTVDDLLSVSFPLVKHFSTSTDPNQLHIDLKRALLNEGSTDDRQCHSVCCVFQIPASAPTVGTELANFACLIHELVTTARALAFAGGNHKTAALVAVLVICPEVWVSTTIRSTLLSKIGGSTMLLQEFHTSPSDELVVGAFIYETVTSFPVILSPFGLTLLKRSWATAKRLSDVVITMHSILSPYPNLRRRSHQLVKRRRGDDGDAPSRNECLTSEANVVLISAFAAHAQAVGGGAFSQEAIAFYGLYEALCEAKWGLIRKLSLSGSTDGASCSLEELLARHQSSIVVCDPVHMSMLPVEGDADADEGQVKSTGAQPELVPDNERFPPLCCPQVSLVDRVLGELMAKVDDPIASINIVSRVNRTENRPTSDRLNFFSPEVSDTSRVLIVARCALGAPTAGGAWVSFDELTELCCNASEHRFTAALQELRNAKLVVVNHAKRTLRCVRPY